MSDFFQQKDSKCLQCLLNKKGSCDNKDIVFETIKKGKSKDILIIMEMPELKSTRAKFIEKILNRNKLFKEFDYEVVHGISCHPIKGELSSPAYKTYENCNLITEKKYSDYKVIITIGRALYSITQSPDIPGWKEFSEYLFNPTYFYTGFNWNKKIRVYPIPLFSEWLNKDNFNNHYVFKQFSFIYDYLKNYSEYKFEPYSVNIETEVNEYLKNNLDKQTISWDIETTDLNIFGKDFRIGCISISKDGNNASVLKYDKINKRLLSEYFSNKYQISANGKFDCKCLTVNRVSNCRVDEDVTLLSHLLSTERILNGLKTLAWYIGFGGYDKVLDDYINKYKINNFLDIPENILYNYAGLDAIVTYRANQYLLSLKEKQPEIYKYYKEVLIPVLPVFMKMEIEGMELDFDYINKFNSELDETIKQLEEKIYNVLGERINLNSSEQLARLFEEKGYPSFGRSKKKYWEDDRKEKHFYYSVGEEQLKSWKFSGYEVADLILQHRNQIKLRDTFVGTYDDKKLDEEQEDNFFLDNKEINQEKQKGIIKFICEDKKLHPTYSPGRTDTIRSSCSGPNLQQMPLRVEGGKKFRPIFKCPDNYYIGEADQSGFQLRIAAIYSKDKMMEDIFLNRGGDMHSVSAQQIFHKNMTLDQFLKVKDQEPYATSRYKAKNQINFPLLFSSSPYVIYNAIKTAWSENEIDKYIEENNLDIIETKDGEYDKILTVCTSLKNKFFETYSGLDKWIENEHDIVLRKGYTDSVHGVRRHLPQLLYKGENFDKDEWRNLMNITINSRVQSFEAYVIYQNMIKIDKEFTRLKLKSKMVAMVHDSLVFYIHKDEVKIVYDIVIKEMGDYTSYNIPIIGEIKLGNVWGNGKELTEKNLNEFIKKELKNCSDCDLRKECISPVYPSKGKLDVLIIGEAPGVEEDEKGIGFIGRSGDILWKGLLPYNYVREDFNVSNINKCFPGKIIKTPREEHIKACSQWIDKEIKDLKPKIILAFGNTNLKYFKNLDGGITKQVKENPTEWNEKYQCWICWSLHPAATLHNGDNKELFKKGIENFVDKVKEFF